MSRIFFGFFFACTLLLVSHTPLLVGAAHHSLAPSSSRFENAAAEQEVPSRNEMDGNHRFRRHPKNNNSPAKSHDGNLAYVQLKSRFFPEVSRALLTSVSGAINPRVSPPTFGAPVSGVGQQIPTIHGASFRSAVSYRMVLCLIVISVVMGSCKV